MRSVSKRSMRRAVGCVFIAVVPVLVSTQPAAANGFASWTSGGQNLLDTRSQPLEFAIGANNAAALHVAFTAPTHGDVSATPAVSGGAVYFPDWGGFLNKLDATTGALIWSKPISAYDGIPGAVSRTAPSVVNGVVYIGDQNGAHLIALKASDGSLIWSTGLDSHVAAILTSSPVVFNNVVYQGVASLEEGFAANPFYPCCTFRGSMTAVNATTGQLIWKTYTIPDNGGVPGGYSGGSVWGGTAVLNPLTGTVYATTGNNYTVPASVKTCEAAGNSPSQCIDPSDHEDSIMAFDMRTGAIKWASGARIFDDWNVACIPGFAPNNCPSSPGPDYDFGAGASLFPAVIQGHFHLVVGAGQKSGQYWAVDANTGQVLWSAAPGPGSTLGGIEWGTATDFSRIYIAEADYFHIPYTLPNGQTITTGSFAALDPSSGRVVWQVADPSANVDLGAVSTANGVVYAGSMSGHMYALRASDGTVLFDYTGQGSSNAGPAVANGKVYWGNGYAHLGLGTPSTTFYAFSTS